jgi:hypothetical protein
MSRLHVSAAAKEIKVHDRFSSLKKALNRSND